MTRFLINCFYFHTFFSVAALLYSVFGVVIEKVRGAEDDINTVAAGTLTGMLFKSGGGCFSLHVYLILASAVHDCWR